MGIGCDMTVGSSGGGWATAAGALNGVNSYRYTGQPDVMYSPYFGPTIKELYDFAAVQPPGTPGSYAVGNATPEAPSLGQIPRVTCKKAKRKRGKKKRATRRICKTRRL
jgi:hypothetical protein